MPNGLGAYLRGNNTRGVYVVKKIIFLAILAGILFPAILHAQQIPCIPPKVAVTGLTEKGANVSFICYDPTTGYAVSNGGSSLLSNAINVKSLGAKGDTVDFTNPPSVQGTIGVNQSFVCSSCVFTPGNIGNSISATSAIGSVYLNTTIVGYVNPTTVTVANTTLSFGPGPGVAHVWYGTNDDAAFVAANALLQSAIVGNAFSGQSAGNTKKVSTTPTVYIPAGNYYLCNQPNGVFNFSGTATINSGITIVGDGDDETFISICSSPTTNAQVFLDNFPNFATIVQKDFNIQGNYVPIGANVSAVYTGFFTENIKVSGWGPNQPSCSGGPAFIGGNMMVHLQALAGCNGFQYGGNSDCYGCITSNNFGYNLQFLNSTGASTGGGSAGARWIGGLIDEGGGALVAGRYCTVNVVNSVDVYIVDTGIFAATGGTPGYGVCVDGTSVVHLVSDDVGQFSGGGGVSVQPGGMIQSTDTRYWGSPSNFCINTQTTNGVSGIFKDLGGNTCTFDAIATTNGITESVNTVTVNTTLNHGFTIGEIVWIHGNCVVQGYTGNFVIATTPSLSSFTYINPTSGLTAGGGAGCIITANNQSSYSGGAPISALTHSLANFTEGVVNLAGGNFGTWTPDASINVTRIQATNSAGNVTCATPIVLTLSNGTISQTLTLTSGVGTWDTGNVSKIFPSGIAITMSSAAGVCATPPVNLNVSVLWQANIAP